MVQYDRDHEMNVIHKYGMEVRPCGQKYVVGKPDWYNTDMAGRVATYPLEYEQGVEVRLRKSQFDKLCQDADRFLELWDFLRDNPDAEQMFYKWRMWQHLKQA